MRVSTNSGKIRIAVILISLLLISALSQFGGNAFAGPVPLLLNPTPSTLRVMPDTHPEGLSSLASIGAAISVNYLAPGSYVWGYLCEAWPSEAQTVFQYAAAIWGGYLNSSIPIVVDACWTNMGSQYILGQGGASLGLVSGTLYPLALANDIYGYDTNGSAPEITVAFNKTFNWYFGTDANPGGAVDFVSVVLHEICHGLGFMGTMDVSGTSGSWGLSGYPLIYDLDTINGSGQSLINESLFPNPSNGLYLQLTGNNLYFAGENAIAANSGVPAKIYAPSSWMGGSSYAHLDYDTYKNSANALMVYMISAGSAIHSPGQVTLGILKDIGWSINSGCSYTLGSSGSSFGLSGGTSFVGVSADAGCAWTAESNNEWIDVTSGSPGSGNGSAAYSVQSYTGTVSRTGTLTVAGQTFTVTQTGCSYALSPDHQNMDSNGGTNTFSVSNNGGHCPWSPEENLSWVVVNSGSGPGSGTVSYTVSANPDVASRVGNINAGDKSFIITQSGVPPVADFSSSAESGIIPFNVIFTDTSLNSPTSWVWDFGDGETSTLQNPTHTYRSSGQFSVTLTAANTNGSDPETKVGYISGAPCADSDRVRRNGFPDYFFVMDAYTEIATLPENSDTLYLQAVEITETLIFDEDVELILRGGYDCGYSAVFSDTIVRGSLTIGQGRITIDRLQLK